MQLEIRSGEGGDDATRFAHQLSSAIEGWLRRQGVRYKRSDLSFTLTDATDVEFLVGTHRVQRVPEGETKRHTSTVTIALVDTSYQSSQIDPNDVEERTYRGTGPGGQHRNTSDTGVAVRHVPTGIEAKVDRGRSWYANRQAAWSELERRVAEHALAEQRAEQNSVRVAQVGRGDRVSHDWTWCAWRNTATHHATGRVWSMDQALRGKFR